MAAAKRARQLGRLAGVHAVADLVHVALDVIAETHAEMVAAFAPAATLQRRFLDLAQELREGQASPHAAGVAGPSFRPNFNSRKAEEFFRAEEWTEAAKRYCNAGETLVREVMTAVAAAIGKPDLAATGRHNQFRSLGEMVAKQVGVSLAREPAWVEFTRVYGVRNNLYAHGQEEASMRVAVEARAAWEGLRAMLATLFATIGVTVSGIQSEALMRRAEEWSPEDRTEVKTITAAAEAARKRGVERLREAVAAHDPRLPASLEAALEGLSPTERAVADEACELAMAAGFETVKRLWDAATDTTSILSGLVLASVGPPNPGSR